MEQWNIGALRDDLLFYVAHTHTTKRATQALKLKMAKALECNWQLEKHSTRRRNAKIALSLSPCCVQPFNIGKTKNRSGDSFAIGAPLV